MSLTGGSKFILTGGVSQYQIARSLRFRASNSAYLSRTPSASNRKTWTWSGWVKRDQTVSGGTGDNIFGCHAATTDAGRLQFFFGSSSGFTADAFYISGHSTDWRVTTQLFRDFAGWYHIVVAWDTTQSTAANRVKLYVNGTQVTSFATSNDPTLNVDYGINQASAHYLGTGYSIAGSAISGPMDGYLSEINFIDGQQLTPSSFGQTDATTGAWNPIKYTGTYGTNGFYLPFSDNSAATSTTIGKDFSGNGNNFTPSGISITAGVTNDSLVDVPTNYGSDTGAGGEVRGNYCTWNPINLGPGTLVTLSNGNLTHATSSSFGNGPLMGLDGTMSVTTGKFKFEFTEGSNSNSGGVGWSSGIIGGSDAYGVNRIQYTKGGTWDKTGSISVPANPATYGAGDVITCEIDCDNLTAQFWKNGVSQGTVTNLPAGIAWRPVNSPYASAAAGSGTVNFGQRPYVYATSSGFKALCTQNLPTPAIVKPASQFNAAIYTGNGTAIGSGGKAISTDGSTANNALLFKPDLVWIKGRSGATSHGIYDVVRTATKDWGSDLTTDETTQSEGVTSFDTTGFTTGSLAKLNTNAATYVSWLWKGAGSSSAGSGSGLTSISSSINATNGLSITAYTGHATGGDYFNHGLGVAPSMVIIKPRTTASTDYGATVWHSSLANTEYLTLSALAAKTTGATTFWNSTTPDSAKVTLGTAAQVNANADTFIAYVFAEVAGFSKFGSYTGNGSTDGPFVWCGFRPRFIMFKKTSATDDWEIIDTARNSFNVNDNGLFPSWAGAEQTSRGGDVLSNGIKLRYANGTTNESGQTYIFAAFAEAPFKTARAR